MNILKNLFISLSLIIITNQIIAQSTIGISIDDDQDSNTEHLINVDSLQNFHKETITGAYVFIDGSWFTSDEIHLTEKLEFIKKGNKSFQYFFFNRNGKIEENVNMNNNDLKFVKDVNLNYGTWFFDNDKFNIVLSGFSLVHGKFEYRISYTYIKTGKNITLSLFEKKLVTEEKLDH